MGMPIIGITGNQFYDKTDTTSPRMSYAATAFSEIVREVGGVPIIIPIASPEFAPTYINMIDKLILTGGQNVLPMFYNEEKSIESDDYLLERDEWELSLIKEARKQGKPIFAVCRGLQLFNVAMGGSLHQDVPNHWQTSPSECDVHPIIVKEDSILAKIFNNEARVNSFHHQAIKNLASNLTILAKSHDSIIEAVTTTDGSRFLGVQWHPELMFAKSKENLGLFYYVVQEL